MALMTAFAPEFQGNVMPSLPAAELASHSSFSSGSKACIVAEVPGQMERQKSTGVSLGRTAADGVDGGSADAAANVPLRGKLVLSLGLGALVAVPAFRALTGLPPYMGMLAGLGFIWLFVDALAYGEEGAGIVEGDRGGTVGDKELAKCVFEILPGDELPA
jgi:hypothetical protein